MKKNQYKIFAAGKLVLLAVCGTGVISLLPGCKKSFLDQEKQGAQPAVTLWQTSADATNAVNAIYGNLRSWNNVAFAPICVESVPSDDAEKGSVPTDATFINNYDNFTVTAGDGQLGGFWGGQYQNINLCNQVLDHIDTMSSVDASLKARYKGEAKFVRAYSYFRLLRAFGNIPLILKVPVTSAELNPPQVDSSKVWAAIEQDLTDAAAALPQSYDAANVGRATKGAALGLHAKVSMYRHDWNSVLNYTNQVMGLGYSLFANFESSFREANENNSESVFEIQCTYVAGNNDLSNSQYSQVQGDRDASNVGWGFNVPTANLVAEFESGDPRLAGTIMMAGSTTPEGDVVPAPAAGAPTMYNMKSYVPFARAAVTNNGAGQNVRVLRYADVLLMNAEANNELGNASAALVSLEKVRARARANSANPSTTLPAVTTTDKTALRNAIYHERRVELAMEFDRFYDLVRQGRAATVLASKGFKAGTNEVMPIPQTEIDISGGVLKQNKGY
ncbi:MAG: RagB/SusD family nutrient uptake outer membrane protein [Chitinophagaceae bacterium]